MKKCPVAFGYRNGCRIWAIFTARQGWPMNKLRSRSLILALAYFATLTFVGGGVLVCSAADDSASLPAPPVAKKEPKVTDINGVKLVDNYAWLREKKNPEVKAYLDAENVYTDAVMKPTEALQEKLYK